MNTIPDDTIRHHILPCNPKEFLMINKQYNKWSLQSIINNTTYDKNKLLINFLKHKNIVAVETLLNSPYIMPSAKYNSALEMAIYWDFMEAIQLLIQHPKFDSSVKIMYKEELLSVLSYGVLKATTATFTYLLSCPLFDPAEDANFAVGLAICRNKLDKVKLLLQDNRVDPSTAQLFDQPLGGDHLPLKYAILEDYHEMVELVFSDPRMQPTGYELATAVSYQRTKVLQVLLNHERVVITTEYVSRAILHGFDEATKVLVHYKNFTTSQLQVILRYACLNNRPAIVEELLVQLHVNPDDNIQRELVDYSPEVQQLILSKMQSSNKSV